MAKLKDYQGRYCESDYENAFLALLEKAGWTYAAGNTISRKSRHDVLIAEDFMEFLRSSSPQLTEEERTRIFDTVHLAGGESDFATLHKVYNWMVYGIQLYTLCRRAVCPAWCPSSTSTTRRKTSSGR